VPATTADGVADRAKQSGYQAEHQDDDSDRPYDRDFGHEANYQQDDSENDQIIISPSRWKRTFDSADAVRGPFRRDVVRR